MRVVVPGTIPFGMRAGVPAGRVVQPFQQSAPEPVMPLLSEPLSRRSLMSGFLAAAAGLGLANVTGALRAEPSMVTNIPAPQPAVSKRSEELVTLVSTHWQDMKKEGLNAEDSRWYIVRPNLYASASVGEQGLNTIRFEMLDFAKNRAEVPLPAVQDNIAALGILAETAIKSQPELCSQIAEALRPFTEKTMVDYRENGEVRRAWLDDNALKEFTRTHAVNNEQIGTRIRLAAQHALGKTADPKTLETITDSLYNTKLSVAQKDAWLETMSTIPPSAPVSEKLLQGVVENMEQTDIPMTLAGPVEGHQRLGQKYLFLACRALPEELSSRLLKSLTTYFQKRNITMASDVPVTGDYLALNALAKVAKQLPSAQKKLLQVLHQHPALMLYANHHYIAASYNPACDAGESVSRALRDMPLPALKTWLLTMVQGNPMGERAENVPAPKPNTQAREVAMTMMATRPYPEYAEYFRKVLLDNNDPLQGLAMIGLANLRQSSDIPFLMNKVTDASLEDKQRVLAIQCVFKIAGQPLYPEKLMQKIRKDFPLHDEFEPMWRFDNGFADFQPDANPFQAEYDNWIAGTQVEPWPVIAQIGQNTEFQQKYLAPMLQTITQKQTGPELVVAMLGLLGASQYAPAEELIGKITEQPRTYFKTSGLTSTQQGAGNATVRAAALKALGGVGKPQSDITTALLQRVIERSVFGEYRQAAIVGLDLMGQKSRKRLADIRQQLTRQPDDEKLKREQVALESALKAHAEMLMDHLQQVDTSVFRDQQARFDKGSARNLLARAIIHQGHEAMVLDHLKEVNVNIARLEGEYAAVAKTAPKSEKATDIALDLSRYRDRALNLGHALLATGKYVDTPEVQYYFNRHFAQMDKVHKMGATGKGEEMLLFDGAFPYPVDIPPELASVIRPFEDKIAYPPWMVFRPRYFEGTHWLMVMSQVLTYAPGIEKFTGRSWGFSQKPDADMTSSMRETHVQIYLDALSNRLRPEDDPLREDADFANSSWGVNTSRIYDPEYREAMNLLAGVHHGLSATGVTSVMSAGNGGTSRPPEESADKRGISAVGVLYQEDGDYQHTPGLFYFAPLEGGGHDKPALVASLPNAANPSDDLTVFTTPGTMEPVPGISLFTRATKIQTGSGSSFAAPSGMAMMACARQLRKDHELALWTPEQEEKALLMASDRKHPAGIHRVDPLRLMILAKTTQVEKAAPAGQ